jgi:crossover junction endodeoxyribonuclease RuvC
MKTILGIDVGATGALSFYDGTELMIYDMPVHKRNKSTRMDCYALHEILRDNGADHAYVEQVNAFGMGASSAYNFGWNSGIIECALSFWGVPFTYVTPQVWKKAMQCPTEKDAARMRATQLLPAHKHNWDLKKHDGRAEASLIALYGFQK